MKNLLKMLIRYIAWLIMYVNVMVSGNNVVRIICSITFIALILGDIFEIKKKGIKRTQNDNIL